jgi:hypothetical protein
MAKLTGAKKSAFLKRMAAGRKKAQNKRKTTQKPRSRSRKTAIKRRVTKTIKRRSSSRKPMARRRSIRRSTRRTSRGIGSSLKTGVIGDVVKGIGASSLVTLVMGRVAPNSSITPIASVGAGFLTGGLIGGAASAVLQGGLSLGGIFGGSTAPAQEFGV